MRYHHPLVEINSIEQEDDILIINFNQEVKAVTPGQHCVLYYRISSGIIVI
ncbi:MAG: aminomethyltransferase beta-barrel domain-containing protein [Patescibacteria group bacterium]